MSERGRKPTPFAIRQLAGDTRKLGSRKFEESLDAMIDPAQGQPDFPDSMAPVEGDSAEVAGLKADFRRRWDSLCGQLASEGLLYVMDGAVIEATVKTMVMADYAFRAGECKAFADLTAKFTTLHAYLGLSAAARVKLTRPSKKMDDLEAALSA